jgi:cysteinyl-tRNA synthetase
MSLKIYNSLTGSKEPFVPLEAGRVRMYVCGVTVYDRCHVGHARSLVFFDVVFRYLRFSGYDVHFVRNFTDVDDKIIHKAHAEGTTADAIAERYIGEFHRDASALGLLSPSREPKATEHISEMIALIQLLEEKGLAYPVGGDVFFAVERFPGYGKLSRKKLDELEAGARVEVNVRKRSPMDFALWKESKEGEPFWESPWGRGRPGWHVECSAMSTKYLGQPFDIHGGGRDLIFPHHENEIAQSEAPSGIPLARVWIHNGFVNIDQQKMSKSLGNITTIREILERYESEALRHYLLSSHYRSPIDFSEQGLEEAARSVDRIYETLDRVDRMPPEPDRNGSKADAALLTDFRAEMDDDFNTPRALALLFEEVRSINRALDGGARAGLTQRGATLRAMGEVLGLLRERSESFLERKKTSRAQDRGLSTEEIDRLIRERERARADRRWQEADRIREQLKEKGIALEDTPEGTVWKAR